MRGNVSARPGVEGGGKVPREKAACGEERERGGGNARWRTNELEDEFEFAAEK